MWRLANTEAWFVERTASAPRQQHKESVEDSGKAPNGERWHVLHDGQATNLRHWLRMSRSSSASRPGPQACNLCD